MAPTVPIDFSGQKQSLMGKSRKYSKGQVTGFVPDYRHAVETMGESEGFGSSGRVDTEMTASEDSYAPSKRKIISLNVDDSFGLPMQVLQLSRMSRSERKDLEVRLNSELEQVRDLQKKIATTSSAIVLSPSSDIRSCSDGKTRPPVEAYHRPSELTGPQGKKRAPHGRNGSRNKKSLSAHVDSVKPVAASNAQLMKQCEGLLNQLMKHQHAWVFKHPVDVVKLNIPDYFTVIKHPMDLGTVKSKISTGGYSNPLSFAADVRLTFSNAMTYNPPGNDVHIMAEMVSKYFEQRWKAVEKKLPVDVDALPSRAPLHTEIIETATPMPPSKKKKTTPNDSNFKPVKAAKPVKPEIIKRIMTDEEKHKLTMEVDSLLGELPESIIDFLKEHSGEGHTSEDEIEIDFEVLSDDTLFTLRKLVDEYLLEKEKRLEKAEPCEMEILNEPGFSNSSLHPCNDMVDEDVDIVGGNDEPMSSFPPVEIEKDAAHRNSKCSSSSSSSSESGSSSSDSDSASSSESESRVPKASPAFGGGKEKLGSEANSEPKRSDPVGSEIGNDPINGIVPVEQKSPSKPISVEAERQEEESAPLERQVSPEKLYRAAVLRNRFADTIFKAKEKALEKDDKLDPEKLRIEREELERRRKEEKARLQAEARAAEEARKKAEAEAAAEARRQRELEREAARQALQMMERTVEINENSRFLEDLEMFRAGDDDHLPHFIEETSPEHPHNELGSFKLQGSSNPLEQLGLFMKADDDIEIEEEEVDPSKNVEEGPSHNELGSVKLQNSSNPLEQLGLFMKADDDTEMEEEEIDPSRNVEAGTSVKLQESSSPLEQLGLFKKADDAEMEEEEIDPSRNVEEGASFKLQESSSPLEQLGLFKKADDDTEMEEEEIDPSRNVEEGASLKLQETSSPLEQLGLFKKADDDTEMEEEEIDPSRNVEEGASLKLQETSSPLEQLGLFKKVDDGTEVEEDIDPSRNVGEGPSNDMEERPSNDVERPSNDVEERPLNDAEERPSNEVEVRPSNDVEELSSNNVEAGPLNNVEEEEPLNYIEEADPSTDVEEVGPSNDVKEAGCLNDIEEGPSNGVEEQPLNEVEEGHSNEVEGPSNKVEERRSNDIEGPSNEVEEQPSDVVEDGPSNEAEQVPLDEVDVEGPPNEVVVEGLLNEVAVEEGPGNDIVEGPDMEGGLGNDNGEGPDMEGPGIDTAEGPANDMEEGPANDMEVDVEGPANEVVEGLLNEVDVEEGPGNDIVEGPDMEGGLGNDIGEGPGIDMEEGPANDMEEGPGNDMEEGTSNVVANEVKEVCANGVEGVEVATTNHVEERTTNHIEEGTSKEVEDVEGAVD